MKAYYTMSYSVCSESEAQKRLAAFYRNFAGHSKNGNVTGGNVAVGGMSSVVDYANSVYSKAKEDLIRKIANDMNNILGMKGSQKLKVDGPIDELVAVMNEKLPNPRKRIGVKSNKGNETKYTAAHKEVCKALAEAINKNYGTAIVDLSLSDNALCNAVSEVVHSLIMGMHSEFSMVAADVSQIIRNLTVLMEYLKKSHEKMKEVVQQSGDENIKTQASHVDEFYKKLVIEVERQLAVLNNMMGGVIGPTNNDFISFIKESDDFKGFVEDTKASLGSEEFGLKLGYLLAGVNNLAQTAKLVDKALKEIGMSVKDYKNTTGIENLRDEIYSILSKADKMTADGLLKFMKAAEVLYANDLQHEQIVEYLEKGSSKSSKGGSCPSCGVAGGCHCGGIAGGAVDEKDIFERKESIYEDKFKAQDKVRKAIFKDFEKQLLSIYQKIVSVVQQIGPKIGSEIEPTGELMEFVRAFNRIEGANRSSIASALSGYNKSGAAKDVRNSFLSSLDVVDITLDPLVSRHGLFKELRNEINILMKLVETFSTKFVDALITSPEFKSTTGGEIGGVIVNTEPPAGMIERYASFGRAQFQLFYFSRISSMKRSMARAAAEKKETNEDYEKLVGQASARLINQQATEYKTSVESLAYWNKPPSDFKTEDEFSKCLPVGSPGRALYFYVNTLSGHEPTLNKAVVPNYFKGNITDNGSGGRVANVGINWNGLNFAGAMPAEFLDLWNFTNPALVGPPVVAAAPHTPAPAQLGPGALTNPATGFLTALGCVADDFRLLPNGQPCNAGNLPRALVKSHKDTNGDLSLMGRRYQAAEKLASIIKELEGSAFAAKKDLVEVAQNVDLYLSSFTDSMLAKPESLLSLAKILQRVAVVRKMYTDASGDQLSKVFEMFPVQINTSDPRVLAVATSLENNGIRKPGQSLADNAAAANVGRAIDFKDQDHYYEYVKEVLDANSSLGNHRLALDLSDVFEKDSDHNFANLMKTIEKSVLGIRALENILLAFVQLGNEQTNKTFMTHGKVLKSLFQYIIYSAISRQYANNNTYDNHAFVPGARVATNSSPDEASTVFTPADQIVEKVIGLDQYAPLRAALSVSLHQCSSYTGAALSGFKDDFRTTDKIMELIMKSISAKILTVLGLYQIYNKPSTEYLSFGAIRSIIGGASSPRPKIIPEAIELYVRVPLLVEWYRDIFVGKSTKQNRAIDLSTNTYMLALVPDVTNQFGELLKTIFIRAENVEEGNYSEDEMNVIITEINKLYNSYKSKNPSDTIMSVCDAIISEVNSRYSIIKKVEIDKYWDTMKKDRFPVEAFDPKEDEDYVDFDLLDSANGIKGRPAPSDKYMDVGILQAARESGDWSTETFELVRKLHARTFQSFRDGYQNVVENLNVHDPDARQDTLDFSVLRYSFDDVIRQYRDELKICSTEEERYKIACKAIQDVGKMADVNPDKIIMLHEFVISPLTTLMSMYSLVRNLLESLCWMSKESLTKVLRFLSENRAIDQQTIGVNTPGSTLRDAANANDLNANFTVIVNNMLRHFNPNVAPLLQDLLVNTNDMVDHGLNRVGALTPAAFIVPETCPLLSTKKLFKTHMQIFAALKNALGDKMSLNFTNRGYPILDINGLVPYCENLLNSVKKALVYLRPNLPPSVIRKYEDSKMVGSVYWLEEHMFSELFNNEKNWTKWDESTYNVGAPVATPADLRAFHDETQVVMRPTLQLLNQILKSSFDVVTARAAAAGGAIGNGAGLCERALMELFAWNLNDPGFRQEVNNDMKNTFPFNVIDMVDDIDPALGKIRKTLADRGVQNAIAEITRRLVSLDVPETSVVTDVHARVFRILRIFANQTNQNNFNSVLNLDTAATIVVNQQRLIDLINEVVPLFINSQLATPDAIGGANKMGSPAFGTRAPPFKWNGISNASVPNVSNCGMTANLASRDEAAAFLAFTEFKDAAQTAFTGRTSIDSVAPAILDFSNPEFSCVPDRVITSANRFGQWLSDQLTELNSRFNPYLTILDDLSDPQVADVIGVRLGGATLLATMRAIRKSLSSLRFAVAYGHLSSALAPGNGLGASNACGFYHIGSIYAGSPAIANFISTLNSHFTKICSQLYCVRPNELDLELRTIIQANPGQHSGVPLNLNNFREAETANNLSLTSASWVNPGAIPQPIQFRSYVSHINQPPDAGAGVIDSTILTAARLYAGMAICLHTIEPNANALAFADELCSKGFGNPAPGPGAGPNFFDSLADATESLNTLIGACAYLYQYCIDKIPGAVAQANQMISASCVGPGNKNYISRAWVGLGLLGGALPAAIAAPANRTMDNLLTLIRTLADGQCANARDHSLVQTFLVACEDAISITLGVLDSSGAPYPPGIGVNDVRTRLGPSGAIDQFNAVKQAFVGAAVANFENSTAGMLYSAVYALSGVAPATVQNLSIVVRAPPPPPFPRVANSSLLVAEYTPLPGLIVGSFDRPNFSAVVNLTDLFAAPGSNQAAVTAVWNNARQVSLNNTSDQQSNPIGAAPGFAINAADVNKAEAYARKFVLQFSSIQDFTQLRTGINQILRDFQRFDLDNQENIAARFSNMNAAFIINRANIYDHWGANGMLANKTSDNERSIFSAKGLLVQFNQLLAAYIGSFVEQGSKKFYIPLIEGLVNSKISDAVTSGNAIADINLGSRDAIGIPPEGAVICASIARAMRSLLYKKTENNKELQFATSSLLEVAGYMKETMKGNLPHFAKMFTQLSDTATFYKKVLLDTPFIQYARQAGAFAFNENLVGESEKLFSKSQKSYINPNTAQSANEVMRYYRLMLDNIESACTSVIRCIGQCYKDLNDSALLGETFTDSLIEVKQKTGKYPLTLPSTAQAFLHHKSYNNGVGLPGAKHGTESFKMLFMFRRLANEVRNVSGGANTLEYMPGIIEVINNYNAINNDLTKLPKAMVESSINNNLSLINLLMDVKLRAAWILDPNTIGASLLRREMYGSALEADVDDFMPGVGYNALAVAAQSVFRNDPQFVTYSLRRGMSPTNQNQSIFRVAEPFREFQLDGVSHLRINGSVDVLNSLAAWPAPGPVGSILAPANFNLAQFSDVVGYPTSIASYAFCNSNNLNELISMSESSDISYNKRHLLSLFVGLANSSTNVRSSSRFFNIMDLNRVPINFHALQRKVPLINLLNYAMTYDKFVIERLGVNPAYGGAAAETIFSEDENNVVDARSAFARMLIHPYADVSPTQFNTWHSRIAVGATGSEIPMDRPKYFSDQIYNKVTLQSLNPSDFENQGGPGYAMELNRQLNNANRQLPRTLINNYLSQNMVNNIRGIQQGFADNRMPKYITDFVDSSLLNGWGKPAAAGPPAFAAPLNAAVPLTVAYITAARDQLLAQINGLAANTSDEQKLKSLIIAAINSICNEATRHTNLAPAAGIVYIWSNFIFYTQLAGGNPPNQNLIFSQATLLRLIMLYVGHAYVSNVNSVPVDQKVDALYYISDSATDKVKRVDLTQGNGSRAVKFLGKLRYDTRLVRNLSWISHMHRFLIWSIKQSLIKQSQPVVNDQGVIDPTLIEFRGYETASKKEYHL